MIPKLIILSLLLIILSIIIIMALNDFEIINNFGQLINQQFEHARLS